MNYVNPSRFRILPGRRPLARGARLAPAVAASLLVAATLTGCGERAAEAPAADGAATPAPGAAPAGGSAASERDAALREHALLHAQGYTCPMHPEITSDEPGECPICGMDLVPMSETPEDATAAPAHEHGAAGTGQPGAAYAPAGASGSTAPVQGATVRVTEGMQQSLGVRVATAESGPLRPTVEAVARVEFDARGAREVRVRTMGFVEALYVRAAGERVKAGQPLFAVYAPMLSTARQDLERARRLGDAELVTAAQARLRALGAQAGESGRVVYRAPVDGVVAELGVLEGGQVGPEMMAAKILPTDRIWAVAAVPEALSAGLAPGAHATLRFAALPGARLDAEVAEVLPELDMMTRTVQARLVLDNAGMRLRPGMVGVAELHAGEAREVVHVPLDAVIRTGRHARVVVALGQGRFVTRLVTPGVEAGDRVEIRDGLAAGERVVVAGQFLIDSESTLRGSLDRQIAASQHVGHGTGGGAP
ncbi:MAG: efflux RND transporter periplasmic adaptor subunit [Steroidobacteraceae bacterium]|nr:efflux RND transporter periplasmic adaptor subunit [Steroidobacteraceae bacterium]